LSDSLFAALYVLVKTGDRGTQKAQAQRAGATNPARGSDNSNRPASEETGARFMYSAHLTFVI